MDNHSGYQEPPLDELINGETVMMSPRPPVNHNIVKGNIYAAFANRLEGKDGLCILGGVDLYLTEKDRFLPDVVAIRNRDIIKRNGIYGAPDLVIEILSSGTVKNDRMYKKGVYARCGVREYWLVNPLDKSVEIYLLEGSELVLHDIYPTYEDWELAQMTPEERAKIVTHFKCSLFDDLEIPLDDIFGSFQC